MKKLFAATVGITLLLCSIFTGCQNTVLNSKKPVTLTLWHNFGGQMKNTMDEIVDEFNGTVGAQKGIILSVTSISGSSTLHEKLVMAANGDPGAPELPDITTAYPKTAAVLAQKGMLVNLDKQFTKKELEAYVPKFLQEGRLTANTLDVFPIAKSTEVVFVNKTLFDRFAAENDVSYDNFKTFEGIAKAAEKYYKWTDAKTPDIKNDGKTFYMPDSVFNLTQIGCEQMGEKFLNDNKPNFKSSAFKRVWDFYYGLAVRGFIPVFNGYGSDMAKTGDIVCTTGSTAGILFFPDSVTYSDNRTEAVQYAVLPYPVFEGGKKIAVQRGSGMCVVKSTAQKEYAAGLFLKWFTSPEQNIRFVSQTGYLPVTNEAFGEVMNKEISNIKNDKIKQMLTTAIEMQKNYEFYIPPQFDELDSLTKKYESEIKAAAKQSHTVYSEGLKTLQPEQAYSEATKDALKSFSQT